jgi:HlyD family secretion protein
MDKAPRINSTIASLVIAALAAGSVALAVEHWRGGQRLAQEEAMAQPTSTASAGSAARRPAATTGGWSASAPGRIEPREGEVRIGAQTSAKVVQVLVRMNDFVRAGDLLVRLADDELMAKLSGAVAEVNVRRRERDSEPAVKLAADRRLADDNLANAERTAFQRRLELDRLQATSGTPAAELDAARAALVEANDKLDQERANVRRVNALAGMPLVTRLEASLAMARSELATLEASIERTRVRAPADGTVLLVNTRVGETASPSPEDVLLLFGDLTRLRVRAELEERDVGKVRPGQAVVVRSDAYPGQDFAGRIDVMANALGAPRIAAKGPRRPSDQDVLQVMVELEGRPPLIPGMRVDVFFRPDATVGVTPADAGRRN